jgi:hypothetical protein
MSFPVEFLVDHLAAFDDGEATAVRQVDHTFNAWILGGEKPLAQGRNFQRVDSEMRPAWRSEDDQRQRNRDHRSPAANRVANGVATERATNPCLVEVNVASLIEPVARTVPFFLVVQVCPVISSLSTSPAATVPVEDSEVIFEATRL